ncbi:MAG TPA: hypothetical protein PLO62_14380 [Candidatus Hydrogenedentes bacterium]|nr:hypothetical protein [Candidatus Hydrogenedentota bacterium]
MFCATWGALKPSERGVWRKALDVFRAAYRRVRGTDTMTNRDIDRLVRDSLSWAMRRDGTQGGGAWTRFSARLREVAHKIPVDDVEPKRLDTKTTNAAILGRAAREFRSWPERVRAADETEVLLHNPEEGSLSKRVKHLVWDNSRDALNQRKAEWLPNVPDTLGNAAARLLDEESGNSIYLRAYRDGTQHMVVVRPDGTIAEQGVDAGKLITQFPHDDFGRQDNMQVAWLRNNGSGRVLGHPNPTPPASTIPGSQPEAFQEKDTTNGADRQGPKFQGYRIKI